jgi:hypothetical protein
MTFVSFDGPSGAETWVALVPHKEFSTFPYLAPDWTLRSL